MGGKKIWELVLEIGHKSTPLKQRLPNGYTHKWTAFVKGTSSSKIEYCVSHVVFQLHESFENPYRGKIIFPFHQKLTLMMESIGHFTSSNFNRLFAN